MEDKWIPAKETVVALDFLCFPFVFKFEIQKSITIVGFF